MRSQVSVSAGAQQAGFPGYHKNLLCSGWLSSVFLQLKDPCLSNGMVFESDRYKDKGESLVVGDINIAGDRGSEAFGTLWEEVWCRGDLSYLNESYELPVNMLMTKLQLDSRGKCK